MRRRPTTTCALASTTLVLNGDSTDFNVEVCFPFLDMQPSYSFPSHDSNLDGSHLDGYITLPRMKGNTAYIQKKRYEQIDYAYYKKR